MSPPPARTPDDVVPDDVVPDDRTRCEWATGPWNIPYHDTEWGVPVHDDRAHFEFLVLEGAQAGLSWLTILKKRDGYRRVFAGFDPEKVARFTPKRIEKILLDPGIIRNRAKVESTVRNARAFLAVQEEFGSFDTYHVGFRGRAPEGQQMASPGADPGHDPRLRGPQRRSAPARLPLRRSDRLLLPPPSRRPGERPCRQLLPLRRAHRRRVMITLAPKRAMTGSSRGRPWARHHSSTVPTSTNPAEA